MTLRARASMKTACVGMVTGLVILAGCSSETKDRADSDASTTVVETDSASTTTVATAPEEPLRILVTNDDGVGADGIAAIADALAELDGVEVTIVAPLENQSGSGGKTTEGELVVAEASTASGRPATSVAGFPADSMVWALDRGGVAERPDLVVSGINSGQNIGPAVPLSGTIGAARAAAARGIPALAVSQGFGEPADYPSAVRFALAWFAEQRDAIRAGTFPVGVTSLNVPTCIAGEVKPPVSVPVSSTTDFGFLEAKTDCTVAPPNAPADDVAAFTQGVATITDVGLG